MWIMSFAVKGETPLFELITQLKTGNQKRLIVIPGYHSKIAPSIHISEISIERISISSPTEHSSIAMIIVSANGRIPFFSHREAVPFNAPSAGNRLCPIGDGRRQALRKRYGNASNLASKPLILKMICSILMSLFSTSILEGFQRHGGSPVGHERPLRGKSSDKETLDNMYDAGFRRLNFSLVDTSEEIHHIQKRVFPAHLAGLLTDLEVISFLVEAHFIIGLPGQKPDDIIDTLIYLMGKRLLPGPSVYYLAPDSPLFNASIGADWQKYIKVMRSSALFPSNPLFPRETIFTFMKLTRFINFVKNVIDQNPSMRSSVTLSMSRQLPANPMISTFSKHSSPTNDLSGMIKTKEDYAEEPQDRDLVVHFFEKIKGKTIRGFKTMNTLAIDV